MSRKIMIPSAVFCCLLAAQNNTALQPVRGLRAPQESDIAAPLKSGKAYALIIGTNTYTDPSWPHLENPEHDAQTIADELRTNFGYEAPVLLKSPTKLEVETQLRAFIDRKYNPSDSVFIFVAGHGKFDEQLQQGYLVFKNSKHNDPLNSSYMAHLDLRQYVDRIPAKRILLVIDACFGGTIDDTVAKRGEVDISYPEASKVERLARKSHLTTRLYLTSGGKEYVADGRPGANSPFAAQILRALRNYDNSGVVSFDDLWQKAQLVRGQQPVYNWFGHSDTDADFWFITSTASPAGPSSRAPASHFDSAHDRDVLPLKVGGKWALFSRQGKLLATTDYDFIRYYSERLAVVSSQGRLGCIDQKGNIAIPLEFQSLGELREGLISACREQGKCGYLAPDGKFAIPPVYRSGMGFSDGLARVIDNSGHAWFIDHHGNQVLDATGASAFFAEDTVGAVNERQQWGFQDRSGKWVIPAAYEAAGSFYRGRAPVKTDGKWQFIDTAGNVVAQSDADLFSVRSAKDPAAAPSGLIPARKNGKWGFVNNTGRWVIPPSYKSVTFGFVDGVAQVTDDTGQIWIDEFGTNVLGDSVQSNRTAH